MISAANALYKKSAACPPKLVSPPILLVSPWLPCTHLLVPLLFTDKRYKFSFSSTCQIFLPPLSLSQVEFFLFNPLHELIPCHPSTVVCLFILINTSILPLFSFPFFFNQIILTIMDTATRNTPYILPHPHQQSMYVHEPERRHEQAANQSSHHANATNKTGAEKASKDQVLPAPLIVSSSTAVPVPVFPMADYPVFYPYHPMACPPTSVSPDQMAGFAPGASWPAMHSPHPTMVSCYFFPVLLRKGEEKKSRTIPNSFHGFSSPLFSFFLWAFFFYSKTTLRVTLPMLPSLCTLPSTIRWKTPPLRTIPWPSATSKRISSKTSFSRPRW